MQDNSHSICQIFASRLGALASLYVYSTYDLSNESLKQAGKKSFEIAKASSTVSGEELPFADIPVVEDSYTTPHDENPFSVSSSEQIDLLLSSTEKMKKLGSSRAFGRLDFWDTEKWFASSIYRASAGKATAGWTTPPSRGPILCPRPRLAVKSLRSRTISALSTRRNDAANARFLLLPWLFNWKELNEIMVLLDVP